MPPQKPQYPTGFTPDPPGIPDVSGFIPDPIPEESLLDKFNKSWINTPLLSKETTGGIFDPAAAANYYDDPMQRTEDQWKIPNFVPYVGGGSLRSLAAGMLEGAGDVVSGLTTPLNLATMGAGAVASGSRAAATTLPGLSRDAYTLAPKVANISRRATQALSVPVIGQGATEAYRGIQEGDYSRAGMGVATMAGGAAGLAIPGLPKGVEPLPVRPPTPPAVELRPPTPPQPPVPALAERLAKATKATPRVEPNPIPELAPNKEVFDPSTLIGLTDASGREIAPKQTELPARPAGPWDANKSMEFVDPKTGEVKSAEQAQPGDIPLVQDKSTQSTAQPAATPSTGTQSFTDWLKNLAGDERGSFDLNALRSKGAVERDQQIIQEADRLAREANAEGTQLTREGAIRRATEIINNRSRLTEDNSVTLPAIGEQEPLPPVPSAPARLANLEFVPNAYRSMFDNMPDGDIQAFIDRFRDAPGYQHITGQNILNHAQDILNDRTTNPGFEQQARELVTRFRDIDEFGRSPSSITMARNGVRQELLTRGLSEADVDALINRANEIRTSGYRTNQTQGLEAHPQYDRTVARVAQDLRDLRNSAAEGTPIQELIDQYIRPRLNRGGLSESEIDRVTQAAINLEWESPAGQDIHIPGTPARSEPPRMYQRPTTGIQQDIVDLGLDRITLEQIPDAIQYWESRSPEIVDYLRQRHEDLQRTSGFGDPPEYAGQEYEYEYTPDNVTYDADAPNLIANYDPGDYPNHILGVSILNEHPLYQPTVERIAQDIRDIREVNPGMPDSTVRQSTYALFNDSLRQNGLSEGDINNIIDDAFRSEGESRGATPQPVRPLRGEFPETGTYQYDILVQQAARRIREATRNSRQQYTADYAIQSAREELERRGASPDQVNDIISRSDQINKSIADDERRRYGPSLEEVESRKKTPASRRLAALVGEDVAQDLISGREQVRSEGEPIVRRGKRLERTTRESWNRWGNEQIESYDVPTDPSKPGIEVIEKPESSYDYLTIIYRDKDGVPKGIVKSSRRGIHIAGISSTLGLNRGTVVANMFGEAYKRGIRGAEGGVSDLTRNYIDRILRIAARASREGGEAGSVNFLEIYSAINDLIKKAFKSEPVKKAKEFIKDESGTADLDRLKVLFEKQKTGTLTPEELAEARQLAKATQPAKEETTPRRATKRISGLDIGPSPGESMPVRPPQQTAREYLEGKSQVDTGPLIPENQSPPANAAASGKPPKLPKVKQALVGGDSLKQGIPIKGRKEPLPKTSPYGKFGEIWNAPRSLQSIDLPGITSAALRQSRPLAFTPAWFRAWGSAVKAFGSKGALDMINSKIENSKYMKPRYEPVLDKDGQIIKYKEKPSVAEEMGLKLTDLLGHREEYIASSLAEKIPGYGRYARASNRAYTAFLNDLRYTKFEQMMDAAEASGRGKDFTLGRKIADFANRATGRGGLGRLEPIAEELGMALYSPRALSARLQFINLYNYTKMDPLVKWEYWKSLARIGASWGAFSSLASLLPNAHVSTDPNNSDFGKIRIGNTRIDPGAGFQQLLVLANRELPQVMGGGGTTSSIGPPGQPGKFTPFGKTPTAKNRLTLGGSYIYNQLNPSLRFVFDMLQASRDQPFDLTDRTLQMALPMYTEDIAKAAESDPTVADFFAPLLSSMGAGVQNYEKGDFGKPKITPAIKKLTGIDMPTMEIR